MRCLILALLVISTLAFEHKDLVDLMRGLLIGVHLKGNPDKLLRCVDDTWKELWEITAELVKKIIWEHPWMAQQGVLSFIQPCIFGLAQLIPCSDGELDNLLKKIGEYEKDPEKLLQKIKLLMPTLMANIKKFVVSWDAKDFSQAGQWAGDLMDVLFIK